MNLNICNFENLPLSHQDSKFHKVKNFNILSFVNL
jgi:hypothetical protein